MIPITLNLILIKLMKQKLLPNLRLETLIETPLNEVMLVNQMLPLVMNLI